MKPAALIALGFGLVAVVALVIGANAGQVAAAVATAGWGVLAVIALHLPQTIASALGWRPLIKAASPTPVRPRAWLLVRLRFIREAVNALLPVAQVGGDVVRARLLTHAGAPASVSAASCAADLTVEVATQAVFTYVGVAALLAGPRTAGAERLAGALAIAAALVALGLALAQRRGLIARLGPRLVTLGEKMRWAALGNLQGFGAALTRAYAHRRRLATSASAHLLSWMLGVLETGAGLWALRLHPSWREALVVESLGQAVRAVGFAIPGALGVQEGGYILICGLFGVAPADALALSLLRRAREIALGVPGLLLWHAGEVRRAWRSPLAGGAL